MYRLYHSIFIHCSLYIIYTNFFYLGSLVSDALAPEEYMFRILGYPTLRRAL